MTRIILSGALGKMGKAITTCVENRNDREIVAGVDLADAECSFPIFKTFADINVDADVIIDFSHPSVLEDLLAFAKEKKIPAVIATTGLNEQQIAEIKMLDTWFRKNYYDNMHLELTREGIEGIYGYQMKD